MYLEYWEHSLYHYQDFQYHIFLGIINFMKKHSQDHLVTLMY